MKLAICEDNPSHYEIIHTILQKYPPGAFEITHFISGDEFLRAAADNGCPYSIVLTDIDLGSDPAPAPPPAAAPACSPS